MADEKPTLDYESPGPAPKNRSIDTATSIVLAVVMVSVAIAQFWLSYANGKLFELTTFVSISLLTLISISLLLGCFRKPQ